jgi:histidine triad (HIT) family protein
MSEPCAFCDIAQKKAPASIVYEDEKVIAFMSIRPINIGHTLVVPKKHYENIYAIPEDEVAHLYRVVKKIAHAVQKAVNAEGIRIVQNNGEAAGQVVFHIHVHIIPMNKDHSWMQHAQMRDADSLKNDAEKIKQVI